MKKVLDLMKRMGENVSTESFYHQVMTYTPIIIKEGLITSYDSSTVLNAICDSFHLAKNGKRKEILTYTIKGLEYVYIGDAYLRKTENGEDIIKIILDTNESFIEKITERMKSYGWGLFTKDMTLDGKYEFQYEKRYPTSFTVNTLLRATDKLYHIAPENVINKITEQGLIPKESKTKGFTNEPRIYLWLNKPEDTQWEKMFKAREMPSKGILLTIDLNKMNKNHIIYFDSRMPDALFSLEPIPPTAITIEE